MDRPEFHLERQTSDGSSTLEIIPVTRLPWETELGRRALFGTGVAVGALVDALSAQTPSKGKSATPAKEAVKPPHDPCRKPVEQVKAHAFSAQVMPIAAGDSMLVTKDNDAVKIWNLNDLKLERSIDVDASRVYLSGDNKTLAAIDHSGVLSLWSAATGKKMREIAGLHPPGRTLLSSDRTLLIADRGDQTAAVYRLSDGEMIASAPEPLAAGSRPALTADGGKMITSQGTALRITPLAGGSASVALKLTAEPALLAMSASGDVIAVRPTGSATVQIWNTRNGEMSHELKTHWDWSPTQLALSADGRWLLTGSAEGDLKLWLAETGLIQWSRDLGDAIESVSLAMNDSRALVLAGIGYTGAKTAYLFSLPNGLLARQDKVSGIPIVVERAGVWMTRGADNTVRISSLSDGAVRRSLRLGDAASRPVGDSGVAGVQVFGDRLVASPDLSADLAVWNLLGEPLPSLRGFRAGGLRNAVFSSRNSRLFEEDNGVIAVWDLEKPCFHSFLFDRKANRTDSKAISYNSYDKVTGRTISYTLPCGSPVPPGAICTCNCVPGSAPIPSTRRSGGTYCTCNKICTCVPIRIPSSRKWKTEIRPLAAALSRVEALRGVRFDWAEDAPQGYAGADIGFIAEEVAEVLPEVVHRNENGEPVAIDYARVTALLVEAIKAQQQQIDELKATVAKLSAL